MTIRSLEIFVKVAECGKMSEVARNMYITQSSVSQAISEIEKEYGVKLFDRISKKLYLTEAGKKLLGYGRHLLAVNEEMNDCMKHCAKKYPYKSWGNSNCWYMCNKPDNVRIIQGKSSYRT